jgi:hypothetical protein
LNNFKKILDLLSKGAFPFCHLEPPLREGAIFYLYKNTKLSRLNALESRLVMTESLSLCNEMPIVICEPAFGGRGNLSLGMEIQRAASPTQFATFRFANLSCFVASLLAMAL